LKLVIVHYHLRPGGLRRVIELATPHIVRAFDGRITRVVLASGESPDRKWRQIFKQACLPTPVEFFLEPAFGYFSEQRRSPTSLRHRIRRGLDLLFPTETGGGVVVWAHNLGLARNLILAQELVRACEAHRAPLLAHHHDWWFDNRWQRWPEARRAGFTSLNAIAQTILGSKCVRHFTINHADAAVMQPHLGDRVQWQPNLAGPAPRPKPGRTRFAREWLWRRLNRRAPGWLLPCRLLRRKNVAEALLLTRWLRPGGWLVTTGGVSSAGEQGYFKKLAAAARAHHWPLRLAVLAGDEARKPGVGELLAASEVVLLTSIQEGFGLTYLEATAAGRPLIARALPNIAPDLKKFGFHLPQSYEEILVHTELFNRKAERARQQRLFRAWLACLPSAARQLAGQPHLLATERFPEAVPFSRLTLTAQLQVLAWPAAHSWKLCAPLNPFLQTWRARAESGRLRVAHWPCRATHWLSGEHYGETFYHACQAAKDYERGKPPSAGDCQTDFIRRKLDPEFLYPLLWSHES
jgi:glycosyltransferase involved in cell wall biosynthesis